MADSDNDSGGGHTPGAYPNSEKSPREHDRLLPIANVGRIMKKALPGNGKISKDAKETVQECVSEFISFITGEASEKCQKEKRKTVNGDDLLWAMTTLGFEDYVEPLKIYLQRFREMEGEKNTVARDKDAGGGSGNSAFVDGGGGGGGGGDGASEFGTGMGMMMTLGPHSQYQAQVYNYNGLGWDGPNHSGPGYSTSRPM